MFCISWIWQNYHNLVLNHIADTYLYVNIFVDKYISKVFVIIYKYFLCLETRSVLETKPLCAGKLLECVSFRIVMQTRKLLEKRKQVFNYQLLQGVNRLQNPLLELEMQGLGQIFFLKTRLQLGSFLTAHSMYAATTQKGL